MKNNSILQIEVSGNFGKKRSPTIKWEWKKILWRLVWCQKLCTQMMNRGLYCVGAVYCTHSSPLPPHTHTHTNCTHSLIKKKDPLIWPFLKNDTIYYSHHTHAMYYCICYVVLIIQLGSITNCFKSIKKTLDLLQMNELDHVHVHGCWLAGFVDCNQKRQ